jgi:glycosyltransferase involved in cell wall biosynthesis
LRIAYITTYDSSDIHNWSGSGTFIRRTLESSGFQIFPIGNLREINSFFYKVKTFFISRVLRKRYHRIREPKLLKNFASQVEKKLETQDFDVVFCPGTSPITYLQTDKPIVVWLDSTFACGINFYPYYTNLCNETLRKGNQTTQLALSKCKLVIFSSEWAARKTLDSYSIEPEKVKVVPFGANIVCNRDEQDIKNLLKIKNFKVCKLLFLGVDWFRKGGDTAVKVAELLNERNYQTELHIVGCRPEGRVPEFVKQHGFISKTTDEGRLALDKLMSESHFLILPSRAESYGIVFAEASSFGLPSLATNVGGITTAIHDGKNGKTFPLDAEPTLYCDYIEGLLNSKAEYEKLAYSSFKEYKERLNWEVSGKKVKELIKALF